MKTNSLLTRSFIVFSLAFISLGLFPQEKSQSGDIQPEEGMEGKNVPWITTPQLLVEKMLELAAITPRDFLVDLGSGDGRIVIAAAKLGTRALGIEYNPDLVKLSIRNAEKEGVSGLTQFIEADIFEFDFSKATVVTMFLLPELNMRLRARLLDMEPGTRIVSSTFSMQEWQFDEVAKTGDESNRWNTAYLWIVPAKVEGKWALPQRGEIIFRQEFQILKGTMLIGGKNIAITKGRLRGNEVTFAAGGSTYTGTVMGNKMEGTYTSGGQTKKWSATR